MKLTLKIDSSKLLFLMLLLFISQIASAQSDIEDEITNAVDTAECDNEYVITVKGDTIPCSIKKPLIGKLKYVPLKGGEPKKIDEKSIKEYYRCKSDYPFVAKAIPRRGVIFIERLEFGKICLYEDYKVNPGGVKPSGMMYGGSSSTSWYVQKSGENKLLLIKNSTISLIGSRKNRKAAFDQLIADDVELYQQFKNNDKYSFNEIRKTIKSYNSKQNKATNKVKD